MTGNGAIPIISTTSFGPAAFGFNPSQLASGAPATPYFVYPSNNPTLGAWNSSPPTQFNGTESLGGYAFIPGTRTVLVFGNIGLGQFCYGDGSGDHGNPPGTLNNDGAENCGSTPCANGGKGPQSYGGVGYTGFIMAYDANDFVAVFNGQKQPYQVTPYAFWPTNFSFDGCGTFFGGVTYDAQRGLIYVSTIGSDTEALYSYLPLIHVFQISSATLVSPGTPNQPSPSKPIKEHPIFGHHGGMGEHEHFHPEKPPKDYVAHSHLHPWTTGELRKMERLGIDP
jgi:hypothetical protein